MRFIKDSSNPIMTWHTEPALVWINKTLYCYYRTDHSIGVMESRDGLSWEDHGVVLKPEVNDVFDSKQVIAPSVLYDNEHVYLYYEGYDGYGSEIGVAISDNPTGPFFKYGSVLQPSKFWETFIVGTPLITKSPSGRYYLFYHGASLGFMDRIGLAYGDGPLGPWTKEKHNPIYKDKFFAWDFIKTAPTSGIWNDGFDFTLFYEGFKGWPLTVHGFNIGGAEVLFNLDGTFFDIKPMINNPILKRGLKGEWDDLTVQRPGVIKSPTGELWMYYSGADEYGFQLGRAVEVIS